MCGRYSQTLGLKQLLERFEAVESGIVLLPSRPQVRPTDLAPVFVWKDGGAVLKAMRWGLVPSWSKAIPGKPLINARLETLKAKPSFKDARRCLIPATSYNEWSGSGRSSVPIEVSAAGAFAMAGVWDAWSDSSGKVIESFAVITTTPRPELEGWHERMPLMLGKLGERLWLESGALLPHAEPLKIDRLNNQLALF